VYVARRRPGELIFLQFQSEGQQTRDQEELTFQFEFQGQKTWMFQLQQSGTRSPLCSRQGQLLFYSGLLLTGQASHPGEHYLLYSASPVNIDLIQNHSHRHTQNEV
jgi:hypothetical protein